MPRRRPDTTRRKVRDAALRPGASGAFRLPWLLPPWIALLGYGAWQRALPGWSIAVLALLNLATLLAYALDKRAARQGRWRTRERTLHLLALLGGWPAAGLAQGLLRHKSRKAAFLRVHAATATLHCVALAAWIFWRPGFGTL